jgi:GNAT superfamily N-acetyltransferase
MVRPARPGDAEAATRLAVAAKASWGYPAEWMERWQTDLTITPGYLETNPAWCAVDSGEVTGFCALEAGRDGWELAHLWVHPSAQGRGAGRALLGAAVGRAGGRLRILSDPHAEAFYRRMGAVPAGWEDAPMSGEPDRRLPVLLISR